MSLGVLNNISAIYAQNNLSGSQASLQKVLQQLSSGSRINSGADDAAGLSIANGLAANSAALTQSSANATSGVGLLQVADGALSQVTSLLNRAVTLATEAGNGTLNSSQNAAAQQEYAAILSEINTIGSTTTFNGNNVFSASASKIFTSDGTATGTTNYNVGVGTLNTLSGVGVTAPGASSTALTQLPTQVTAGTAAVAYAAAAADVYTLTSPGTPSSTDVVTASSSNPFSIEVGSTTYNIAVPSAGETLSALAAQISSTLGSSIGSASASAAGVLTITGLAGSSNAITLVNANSLYDVTGTAGALTLAHTTTASNAVAFTPAASEVYQINGASAADTFTSNGLTVTVGGVTSTVFFSGANGTDTQAQLIANLNSALGATATAAASGSNITITGSSTAASFSIAGTVTDQLASGGSSSTAASAGQVLTGTNLSTITSAAQALNAVYTAISDVAYQRGAVGANINTLTAVSNVETTQNVNVSSAANTITATDYGQATSNLSKYEILSQTGISALAQANSVQQEVLKLLQ